MLAPLHDLVLVQPLVTADFTEGGIFLPDAAKDKPSRGTVVAVGPGKVDMHGNRHKPDLKPGDQVLFEKYAATQCPLEDEGQKYLLMKADQVHARLVTE